MIKTDRTENESSHYSTYFTFPSTTYVSWSRSAMTLLEYCTSMGCCMQKLILYHFPKQKHTLKRAENFTVVISLSGHRTMFLTFQIAPQNHVKFLGDDNGVGNGKMRECLRMTRCSGYCMIAI